MELGMIGLGRMGANMARRLLKGGHSVTVYDADRQRVKAMTKESAKGAYSLKELVEKLAKPRVLWMMVPAGEPTESVLEELLPHLSSGDIVVDGGNTYYKDDLRRAKQLDDRKIHYVDVGTSGGIWGLERGYCMMVGGDNEVVAHLRPIFETLAPEMPDLPLSPGRTIEQDRYGYVHVGRVGSGHFVKMVHNGIEYGVMQAYAEGFNLLFNAASPHLSEDQRFELNIADIAEVWRRGSVITSWLLDLTAAALAKNPTLDNFGGVVQDSGEGRWTIERALEQATPVSVLAEALFARFSSRDEAAYANRILSAMRKGFGGHEEPHRGSELDPTIQSSS